MHLGIAILMSNKPAEEAIATGTSTLFTFLEPLSFSVWVGLLGVKNLPLLHMFKAEMGDQIFEKTT
jgi:hypothetical protein